MSGISHKQIIIASSVVTAVGLAFVGWNYFELDSRFGTCNRSIEALLDIYSDADFEKNLQNDASKVNHLFKALKENNCRDEKFVEAKYKKLSKLIQDNSFE